MEGTLVNYRRGRRTMSGNQMIVEVKGFDTKAKAAQLIGKRLVWRTPANKEINGKIVGVHGGKGAVRARFNRGMPGQAIGEKVEITEKAEAKPKKQAKPEAPAKKATTKKKTEKK